MSLRVGIVGLSNVGKSTLLFKRNTTSRKRVDEVNSDEVGLAKREQEDTPTVSRACDLTVLRSRVDSFNAFLEV